MNETPRNPESGKTNGKSVMSTQAWHPFGNLRQQIDRLFDDFDRPWHLPFNRAAGEGSLLLQQPSLTNMPAVDVVEKDNAYEITAELPGMDEKDIEVKLMDGNLVIKGEKRQEREQKDKGYYLSERSYGAFQRSFGLPDQVDSENISASFSKGVLTLTLPKKPGSQEPEKRIDVKVN